MDELYDSLHESIGEEFDEDLYGEQLICFLHCIKKFSEIFL